MHTIQLQIIPLRKVLWKVFDTFPVASAAAAPGTVFMPAAITSFASKMHPTRLPVHDILQLLSRDLRAEQPGKRNTKGLPSHRVKLSFHDTVDIAMAFPYPQCKV